MSKAVENLKVEAFHHEQVIDIDPAAEKRLVRKIDLYLMPSVFVLYLFSYVVRWWNAYCPAGGVLSDSR